MKKYILILFIIFLCCGCGVKYNISIDEKLKIEEKVSVTESAEFYSEYEKSSVGRVVSIILAPYLDTLNDNNYTITNSITSTSGGVVISKNYNSIDDYVNNTIFKSQFTDDLNYSVDGNKVTIVADGNFSYAEQDQSRIPVDKASISIKLPFKVLEHTADEVDGDTYIWNFDKSVEGKKEIKLVFNKSRINKEFDYRYIIGIIIIITIIACGFIWYKKFKEKKDNANTI